MNAFQAPLPVSLPGRRRLLALLLVVMIATAGLPGLAATAGGASTASGGGGSSAVSDLPTQAGSFQLGTVRILGIPTLIVASPALQGGGTGPDASQRARVIEGNLSLLYRNPMLCSPGETLAENFAGLFLSSGARAVCRQDPLGLGGPPEALEVAVVPQPDGLALLEARLKGRDGPVPLLTVTFEDARLYGTSPEQLALRWGPLLQARLRLARRLLAPGEILHRWRRVGLVELGLGLLLTAVLVLWRGSRRWVVGASSAAAEPSGPRQILRRRLGDALSVLLLACAFAVLVMMAGVATFAVPGEVPLALDLFLQPLAMVVKLLVVGAGALILQVVSRALMSQWAGRLDLPPDRRARRLQRSRSLRLMTVRLINLAALAIGGFWVLVGLPGVQQLSSSVVLASGALLGALAIVFQGLLRDFAAGLVVLVDDRYAIGDTVDLGGFSGEVVDLGVLSTQLRCSDQRVVTVPNSRCEPVVNRTKLRSGAELTLPLAATGLDLPRALAAIGEEARAFADDPRWQKHLLQSPVVRGVSEVNANGVNVSLVIATVAGQQGAAKRALLGRIVERLGREGIALATA
ncbi:mechanosensitive ion channel family protein [Cyanobium sp. FGCU-6]|nr:mechanosensitive ion channel family protein [Cyanobium sp. FGCU6]